MNNKQIISSPKSITLAVAVALSQLVASNVALADSVREWGYWDSPSAAGPNSPGSDGFNNIRVENISTNNNSNGGSSTGDQRIVGIDNSQFAANNAVTVPVSDYVGYTFSYAPFGEPKAGTVYIDIAQGAERVADRQNYEYVYDCCYYYYGGTYKYVYQNNFYDSQLAIKGTFNGETFNLEDSAATLSNYNTAYYYNDMFQYNYGNSNISSESGNTYFSAQLGSSFNGQDNSSPFKYGYISTSNASGPVLFGKPVSATQIAEQLRLGQTYNFSGGSSLGSSVQIAVNFQNATWNGTWSPVGDRKAIQMLAPMPNSNLHNGFSAAGGISGSTLTSSSVTGAGSVGAGFVTGGKVDATLVGAINGLDASAAAVIGKTVVNVQQTVGTATIGDTFSASSGRFVSDDR